MDKVIYKENVYYFINKVKEKAVNAVRAKHNEKIKEAIEEYFAQNENQNFVIDKFTDAMSSLSKIYLDFKKLAVETFGTSPYSFDSFGQFLTWENGSPAPADIKLYLQSALINGNNNLKASSYFSIFTKARSEEIKETENAYSQVMSLCQAAPTGNKGVEILKSLGFDVAYFDKIEKSEDKKTEVNTEKLFPCGERK
jgi:hypothetical protein